MPAPTAALNTLRPDLGGSFMEFNLEMESRGYIATRALPVITTMKQSGPFGKIPIEQLLQQGSTARAPGANYSRGNWTFTTDTFACEEHGWEEVIDDRERAMYSDYFDAEQISTQRAFGFVLRNAEIRAQDLLFNTSTWTATNVTNEWDDATNGVPITDIETAVQKIYGNTGIWPDTLIITRKVFRNLRLNTQVKDAIAASGAGFPNRLTDITVDQLAQVFDLPKILVANGSKNNAVEGQTADPEPIWDDEYAMICKTADTNDIREPCVGRTFHWNEDGSELMGRVESYRDETIRGDVVRVRHDVDEKVLYTELGELLGNITA